MSKSNEGLCLQNVKNYCDTNEDFAKILALFTNGYMSLYNKRKTKHREKVQMYLKRNFFTWYYSEANYLCVCSPAFFIASHLYHKFGGGFTVVPIPAPDYKKSKLESISYSFKVLSVEEHPLFHDMNRFMDAIRTGTGENCDFSFGNQHYLEFLTTICFEAGLLQKNAERVSVNDKKLAVFSGQSPEERLHKLLSSYLGYFLKKMKEQNTPGKLPSLSKILKLLAEGHEYDDFLQKAFPGLMKSAMNFISSYNVEDFEDMDEEDFKIESFAEEMGNAVEMQFTLSYLSSVLFVACGLYFQVIQPDYSCFDLDELDGAFLDMVLNAKPEQHKLSEADYISSISYMIYFKPANAYAITPIGAKILNKNYESEEAEGLVEEEEYEAVLEAMLHPEDGNLEHSDFGRFMDEFKEGLFR